jgi:DNA integrity scanning protein DisA with diadenylate cyclase activity
MSIFLEILKNAYLAFNEKIGDFFHTIETSIGWSAAVDIILTTVVFWWLYKILRGSKFRRVLYLILILIAMFVGSQVFELVLLHMITQYLAVMLAVAIPIIFNKEIQRYFKNKDGDEDS